MAGVKGGRGRKMTAKEIKGIQIVKEEVKLSLVCK